MKRKFVFLVLVLVFVGVVEAGCSGTIDCSLFGHSDACGENGCVWTSAYCGGNNWCTATKHCKYYGFQNTCDSGIIYRIDDYGCTAQASCSVNMNSISCSNANQGGAWGDCVWVGSTGCTAPSSGSCDSFDKRGSCEAVGCIWEDDVPVFPDCPDERTVMRLSSETNAHVAVWDYDGEGYDVEVCSPVAVKRDCSDDRLWLRDDFNSHVSLTNDGEYGVYGVPVCMGGTDGSHCRLVDVGNGGACNRLGESVVLSLYQRGNSHVSVGDDVNYDLKICCGAVDDLYWADMNGNRISETDFGDSVKMVLTGGVSGSFEIKETTGIDSNIRTGADAISGVLDSGKVVGVWNIVSGDLDRAGGDYGQFVCYAGGLESEFLEVGTKADDEEMSVEILSPLPASYYDEGEKVGVVVDARDADDEIFGEVKIGGIVVGSFGNGVTSFDYTFDSPGNVQVVASATNSRGKTARFVSSVMILDMDGGNYVSGKSYVAACIGEPRDSGSIEESTVFFDASCSRAIDVVDGGLVHILPGSLRLSWDWEFSVADSGGWLGRSFLGGEREDAYKFFVEFPTSGDNWASLSVGLD